MRILITGASGSGTTTLGCSLAQRLSIAHFDADDYYWLPTKKPFTSKREKTERLSMLLKDLGDSSTTVVSGSIINWGRELEDAFDLIVFLYLEAAIRVERLRKREMLQLGKVDEEFINWAAQYDSGQLTGRNLKKHRKWLSERKRPVLELSGDLTVDERMSAVLKELSKSHMTGGIEHPQP